MALNDLYILKKNVDGVWVEEILPNGLIPSNYGGTGNGFTKFTGPASSEKTFTLPNADATLAESGKYAGINAQTGTTYTLVLTDVGKLITLSNGSSIAVTIPLNSSVAFPVGTQIDCVQIGAGKVTFSGSGVTINSKGSNKSINGQYVGCSLIKTATDTWLILGDLIA
jgi:hypothetical protein